MWLPSLPRRRFQPLLVLLLTVLSVVVLGAGQSAPPSEPSALTVTGIQPNHSSVRIFYEPVPGAADYRVFDINNPYDVKYAGRAHYVPADNCPGSYCLHRFAANPDGSIAFPYQSVATNDVQSGPLTGLDVPANDIEWNVLNDTAQHTLIVQAVDVLGPAPKTSMYSTTPQGGPHMPLAPGGMLGSNKGPTADGNFSTNGQGPTTNAPKVVAQSQPFVVQADPSIKPVGTGAQTFLDTFDQSEAPTVKQVAKNDCATDAVGNVGVMSYSINAGTPKEWTLEYRQADNSNSMPFISNSHFMDMLFDGATPSCGATSGTIYGSMAMTPKQTVTAAGGVLHLTMEVDAHASFRRWMAFDLSPAADPLQSWEATAHQINRANQGLYFEMLAHQCELRVFNGPASGPPAVAFAGNCDSGAMYMPEAMMENGRGLDDRSRIDLFVSQTHLAAYQDNKRFYETDIPASAMPWFSQALKVYYTHYLYHSEADLFDLKQYQLNGAGFCFPLNSYWFNDPAVGTPANGTACNIAYPPGYGFPHSDERHWDNMGFEVLPNFSTAATIARLQPTVAPQFTTIPDPPATTPTAGTTNTATSQPTATATPTPGATSTATSVPSGTPTSTPAPSSTVTPSPTGTSTPSPVTTLTAVCELLVRSDGGEIRFQKQDDARLCGG